MQPSHTAPRLPRRAVAPALLALALALGACNLPNQRYVSPQADVTLRKLAADDASTSFDALDLGLLEIRAIAPTPDGGALVATDGGLWRYGADGQAKLVGAAHKHFASIVPDGKGGFLAFLRRNGNRRNPSEVWRLDAEGVAARVAAFPEWTFVRAVAPGPDGAVRALVMIDRREGGSGRLSSLEGAVWEARDGAEPTKLRDLAPEDAQAIGVPEDEQGTGVDAAGRFVLATGRRRYLSDETPGTTTISIGVGPRPTAAEPLVPGPTELAVRLDPLAGGVEGLEVDGHRVAIDGQGNRFGLDAETGALIVRGADDEPRTLLEAVPGPAFPRAPGQELALRAALGADGAAFLAPELPLPGDDGPIKRPAMAPKITSLMRVADGAATLVMGAEGGQQGTPRAGAFDLLEPQADAPFFMKELAMAPDGRIAMVEADHRIVRVLDPGKALKKITWPAGHVVSAIALAPGGVPWVVYRDERAVPAPFPANVFGGKDHDERIYLGKLANDGTIERRATLLEKNWEGTIDELVVRPDGSAFAVLIGFQGENRRSVLHVSKAGAVKAIWSPGEGRASSGFGNNLHTPACSLGLAPDGAVEIVAGTQHARVAPGKSTTEDLPDLPFNGAYPAVDPAGRLHLATEGPTVKRVVEGGEPVDVLAGLFDPASLSYRLQALDRIGFDDEGHLFVADRRQQRLFRIPANRLP